MQHGPHVVDYVVDSLLAGVTRRQDVCEYYVGCWRWRVSRRVVSRRIGGNIENCEGRIQREDLARSFESGRKVGGRRI